jgi:heme/copper-type cytochrome/quinol oxidase subunit 2
MFLTSGIYWGQCMEICGRFHHWMPIVVYFLQRDLFVLWCSHFIHYDFNVNIFNMNDKQIRDHARILSYNKSSWVQELLK